MCGSLAEEAEVAGCPHDSGAEVVLPDAIDYDSRGERMRVAREPAGQLKPAAALRDSGLILAREDDRKTARHQIAEAQVGASDVDLDIVESGLRALRAAALLRGV